VFCSRWLLLWIISGTAFFSTVSADDAVEGPPRFEFHDGDRIVLLGSTFIERLQSFGYVEMSLTANCSKDITFRNLGWSGDDVWGTARAVFGTQKDGFKRLVDDVQMAKPTVILVAYGANEANAGMSELPRFVSGLEQLLDRLEEVGARLVLIAPPHRENIGRGLPSPEEYNESLRGYSAAIEKLAKKRHLPYVDLYNPISDSKPNVNAIPKIRDRLTDDGMQFNPYGQWRLGPQIASTLGVVPSKWQVNIDIDQVAYDAVGTTLSECDAKPDSVRFVSTDRSLPYSVPPRFSPRGAEMLTPHGVLKIIGLQAGKYGLRIDEAPAIMADHEQWASGVHINLGQYTPQVEQLRQAIIEKNSLFFHRYRPQNETYLFLFRKHEQGNNAVEVAQFERLVAEKEAEIARLKVPRKRTYQLVKLKPTDGDATAPTDSSERD
jgi:lysophospholipase L1-like esterase